MPACLGEAISVSEMVQEAVFLFVTQDRLRGVEVFSNAFLPVLFFFSR